MGIFEQIAFVLVLPAFCQAQALTPAQALDRYLNRSLERQAECSDLVTAVQIDASLPKLRKQASMSGLRLVSQTGQIVYRGLRFTGDNIVKTAVIARFLNQEAAAPEGGQDVAVTRRNYSLVYEKTADYNGMAAYVFLLTPRRKRVGLFKGELWLEAATAAPLRLWGDFVKSPSIFVSGLRFVQDYRNSGQCVQPVRLLLTVRTRIAGDAEMAVQLHSADVLPDAAGSQ
jgi:hypothetical protein